MYMYKVRVHRTRATGTMYTCTMYIVQVHVHVLCTYIVHTCSRATIAGTYMYGSMMYEYDAHRTKYEYIVALHTTGVYLYVCTGIQVVCLVALAPPCTSYLVPRTMYDVRSVELRVLALRCTRTL